MSDLEERALRAAREEQADRDRNQLAAQRTKDETDEEIRAQLAETAVASVEAVLGVATRQSDWALDIHYHNPWEVTGPYPVVQTRIEGIIVTSGERGGCMVSVGATTHFDFSLAGFGEALKEAKARIRFKCRYCGHWKQGDAAAHEEECYRLLPWHKKIFR
jgi:hypothetical protein